MTDVTVGTSHKSKPLVWTYFNMNFYLAGTTERECCKTSMGYSEK